MSRIYYSYELITSEDAGGNILIINPDTDETILTLSRNAAQVLGETLVTRALWSKT